MESFVIEIAELVTCVSPLFGSTKEYCKAYLSHKDAEFSVSVTKEDLLQQQILLEREAVAEGLKIRKFQDPFLERAVIQRKVADQLLHKDTLMVHGSTVAVDNRAYLFTAPCGTGKSTHARLWRDKFGERAVMVNDDKPFLKITDSGVLAYGSPWSGKHGLDTNISVPLQGICFLERGSKNVIRRINPELVLSEFLRQTHIPADPGFAEKTLSLVEALLEQIPLWKLSCNKELEAATVSYSAMCDVDSDFAVFAMDY